MDMENEIKNKKMTIEKLAIMVASGFENTAKDMDGLKKDAEELKGDVKDVRRDILNLRDRFISYHTFDALVTRVKNLEERKK